MFDLLKKPRFPQSMLAHLICIALFCPVYISYGENCYAPDLVLCNFFALLVVISVLAQRQLCWRNGLLWLLLLGLLVFNAAAAYANAIQLDWYYSQINISISFLLFVVLACGQKKDQEQTLTLLLKVVILSNAVGLLPFLFHSSGLSVYNGLLYFRDFDEGFSEIRYNWVYTHKSEYALMLVMGMALLVTYRHRIQKKWYYAGVEILALGLIVSHTFTTMVSALFIFIGLLLDMIRKQPKTIRRRYLLLICGVLLIMLATFYVISQQRNLLSLGSRLYIWKGAIAEIRENPYGIGRLCGIRAFSLPDVNWEAYNCHNVFLNWMLQLSICAGLACIGLMAVIAIASLIRKPSFLTIGIWIAILIPMMMDWCLLIQNMSIFFLMLYFIFFYQEVPKESQSALEGR